MYFCFCASVPKYKIGKVPIPVCAAIATLNEKPPPRPSFTNVEVIKSLPKPPKSSGVDAPNKPCSPAFSISDGMRPGSSLSIRSITGKTSVSKNCRHISLTIICSSLKSSGVKVSKALLSLISHSPPFSVVAVCVVVLIVLYFKSFELRFQGFGL